MFWSFLPVTVFDSRNVGQDLVVGVVLGFVVLITTILFGSLHSDDCFNYFVNIILNDFLLLLIHGIVPAVLRFTGIASGTLLQ